MHAGSAEGDLLGAVRQIMSIPFVELLDVSRDGRFALVLTNQTGSFQLASLALPGGSLELITQGIERVSWAQISHSSRVAAFSRDFGGKERHQLFRVPLNGGEEEQITDLPPIRVFPFSWSNQDDRIAFAGATQDFNGIWTVDVATGEFQDVYRTKHWTFGPVWSPGDSQLCFTSRTTEAPTARELVFMASAGDGTYELYTPKKGAENLGPSWHPKERGVLFRTDARGRYELAVYEPDTRRLSYLRGGELDLGLDFPIWDWTPDGNEVYYLAARNGRTRLYVEPADASEKPREVPIPEGFHAGFLGAALKMSTSGVLVFSWSTLSSPHRISQFDFDYTQTTTHHVEETDLALGRAEHVVYRSFDGLPIHGWFLRPPRQGGRRPCVLWIHGGPAWEVADEWHPEIQAFVLAGYPVFAPNIRGSSGYGADFQNLNLGDIGGGDLRDVVEAVKYLRSRPDVDPSRIAIVGASYGGFMTFLAMTKCPELWAAGAAIVGITDWNEMYELSDAAFRSFIERYFGPPEENADLYRDRSPIHYVENLRAPLLIWHRGNDSRCPLEPIQKFASRLQELGKPHRMEVVWDEGHGFQKTENLVRQYQTVVQFLLEEVSITRT